MKGLRVGPYTIDEVIHEGPNLMYFRGVAQKSGEEVLLCFLANKVDTKSTSKRDDAENPLAQAKMTIEPVSPGRERECPRLLPLIGMGDAPEWKILVYPFVRAIPFCLHMKTVPTIRRREALQYTINATEIIVELHKRGFRSGEVHIGNIFIDAYDQIFLGFNHNVEAEVYKKEIKGHAQVKRFDVISPEEVWGNGAGKSTDIFQLGAFLTTMLTRRLLVLPPDVAKMDFKAALNGLYPPADFTQGIPRNFEKMMAKVLAPDPIERFENIGEFVLALNDLMEKARITDAVSDVVRQGFVRKAVEPATIRRKKKKKEERSREAMKVPEQSPKPKGKGAMAPEVSFAERLGPAAVPLLGGGGMVVLLLFIFIFGIGGDDGPTEPTRKPPTRKPTKTQGNVSVRRPTRRPRPTKKPKKETIDVTALTPKLNEARARPTDDTNFKGRKKFLQKCYLALPRSHRGKAISSSVFQRLFDLAKKDKKAAYKLLDDNFAKYEKYLRDNNAKM